MGYTRRPIYGTSMNTNKMQLVTNFDE